MFTAKVRNKSEKLLVQRKMINFSRPSVLYFLLCHWSVKFLHVVTILSLCGGKSPLKDRSDSMKRMKYAKKDENDIEMFRCHIDIKVFSVLNFLLFLLQDVS